MYRKRKFIKAITQSLKRGTTIFNACQTAGLPALTFWRWRVNNPRLDNLINKIIEGRIQMVEDALFKNAIINDDIKAQIFYLKNRGKDWKDTPLIDASRHQHTTFIKGALIKAEDIDANGRIKPAISAGNGK